MHMPRSSGPGVQTVIAAQAGDAEALDSLLSGYLPLIYNIVGRGLSGHADVDDVVQETMLRAVRGLATCAIPPRSGPGWSPWPSGRCAIITGPGRPSPPRTWPTRSPTPRPTSWS
jgi:hypothetical protein